MLHKLLVIMMLFLFVPALTAQKVNAQITVTPETATIAVNATVQLTSSPAGPGVQWTSLNPAIATVTQSGLVTGLSAGVVTIRAKLKGDRDTATITVTGPPPPPQEICGDGIDNDGDGLIDENPPCVPQSGPAVSVSPTSIATGDTVTVSFSDIASPSPTDWLALAPAGSSVNTYFVWMYAGSCTQTPTIAKASGSCQLTTIGNPGPYEIRLFANDQFGLLAITSLTLTEGTPGEEICGDGVDNDGDTLIDENPPCAPPPVLGRGPTPNLPCPGGAVVINEGQNIQSIINTFGAGTTYCIVGTFTPTAPIRPKAGDILHGQYPSTINGQNVSSGEGGGVSVISGWNCSNCANVQVRNLFITGRDTINCIGAYGPGAGHWTFDHNDISGCRWGLNGGMPWVGTFSNKTYVTGPVVSANVVHHNVMPGATGSNGSGAYGFSNTNGAVIMNNEFAFNGQQAKLLGSINSHVYDNFYHHNGVGVWLDGDNMLALIETNVIEDNCADGIFYEISATGNIRNNVVQRNGHGCAGSGIFISTSRETEVSFNTVKNNFRDINLFVNCGAVSPAGTFYPTQIEFDLRNVSVRDNLVGVGQPEFTVWGSSMNTTNGTCSPAQVALYGDPNGIKNNRFTNNDYEVFSLDGSWWFWNGLMTWAQWQALGQDVTGTVVIR